MKSFDFKSNNFDLIRLLAAFQVLTVHSYEHLGLDVGKRIFDIIAIFPGVPVFFVTSGFLISSSWKRSSSYISYMRNRFLRIYPALWVSFLVSCIVIYFGVCREINFSDFFIWAVAQNTFLQFYNPDFLRDFGVGVLNGSLWTISVELQFYLLLPLLFILFIDRTHNCWFLLLFFIFLGFNFYFNQALMPVEDSFFSKIIGVTILPYFYMFLIGVFLSKNIDIVKNYLANKWILWLLVYIGSYFLISTFGFTTRGNHINPISAVLLSLFVISFAYSFNGKGGRLLSGVDISYGLYIYHMIFVNVLLSLSLFTAIQNFLIVILVCVLVSLLSWNYIEKPALSLKNYSLRKRRK